jgi:hypothetical protein
MKRATMKSICLRLGGLFHCSSRTVKAEYLPYLKQLLDKDLMKQLEITDEEMELLK